jgi:hypothetical protein
LSKYYRVNPVQYLYLQNGQFQDFQKSMAGNDSGSIVSHLTSLQILQNLRK